MKKVPGYDKDENGIYSKVEPKAAEMPSAPKPVLSADISLDGLLNGQLLTLSRVTTQLLIKSVDGLSKDDIQSLATITKLTMDLKAKEKQLLDDMSDEELEVIANRD